MVGSPEEQHKSKGKQRSSYAPRRQWTIKEDKVLISALSRLSKTGWKSERGKFKNGYTTVLEKELKSALPGCDLKASPHIESRIKLLKRQFDEITAARGAKGMQWNDKAQKLICEDDAIWKNWLKSHPLSKALRNKQFLYYNDLAPIFGNRSIRKGYQKAPILDETINGEEEFSERNRTNDNHTPLAGAPNSSNENTESGGQQNESDKLLCSAGDGDESVSGQGHAYDTQMGDGPNDLRLLVDATTAADIPPEGDESASAGNARRCDSYGSDTHDRSPEPDGSAKIFGTLETFDKHLSILVGMIGREAAAGRASAKKRAGLNEELKKLQNLNLQARLRAATLIVSDSAKLDLFYSLSMDERSEWVSMLLSGLL